MESAMKRTLLIGLDAACWEYLDPLLEAGRLPNLQRLISNGVAGTLQSTLPAWTPTAWASIITGKNPGKHGVYGMMWRRPGTFDFVSTNATVRQGTPFWTRLNDAGVRVGLVNVPFTHPPDPIDGFVVCGFGAPSTADDLIYPEEARQWVRSRFADYAPGMAGLASLASHSHHSQDRLLQAERRLQAQQVEIALELAQCYDVHVLVINLMLLDHANHRVREMKQVEKAICLCDADIGRLIRNFGSDNVMVISDHGSRRVKGDFLLLNYLVDAGYSILKPRTQREHKNALNHLLARWLKTRIRASWVERMVRHIMLGSLWLLPDALVGSIWRQIEKDYPTARRYVACRPKLDLCSSRLIPGSQYAGLLYGNDRASESGHTRSDEDRHELCTEVCERLAALVDPDTGESLLAGLHKSEALYHGPQTRYAPDIVIDSFSSSWGVLGSYNELPLRPRHLYFVADGGDSGQHSRNGIYVLDGLDFQATTASCKYRLMDVAPTLLCIYDVPLPDDYDGIVMHYANLDEREIGHQDGDFIETNAAPEAYTSSQEDELLSRLRALGYVE